MADFLDRLARTAEEAILAVRGLAASFRTRFERRSDAEVQDDERDELPSGEVHWSDVPGGINELSNFRLYGKAWLDPEHKDPMLVVVDARRAWRGLISQFFPERRVAYPKRNAWRTVVATRALGKNGVELGMFRPRPIAAFALGAQRVFLSTAILRLKQDGEPIAYPLAIAADRQGDFRDCRSSTDYEDMLNANPQIPDAAIRLVRAQIKYMIKERITLHPRGGDEVDPEALGPKVRKRVLIVGLSESKAQRVAGGEDNWSDEQLIRRAMEENSGAEFVYLPNRRKKHAEALLSERTQRKLTIIKDGVSAAEILRHVDHVYVASSIIGLDALLRGIPVTTFGVPFYSGWGLSDDRGVSRRRHAKVTLEQFVHVTFHQYFRYVSAAKASEGFAQTLRRHSAYRRELYAPSNWPVAQPFLEDQIFENAAVNLALVNEDLLPEGAKFDPVLAIHDRPIPDDFVARFSKAHSPATTAAVLPLIVRMLSSQVRYDELKFIVQQYRDWFERLGSQDLTVEQSRKFLTEYGTTLRKMFGRSVERGPNYNALSYIAYRDFLTLLPAYVRVLATNVEYARAEEIIASREIYDAGVFLRLTAVFSERPGRSERDGFKRARLRRYCATRALDAMDREFSGWTNAIVNRLLYYVALDEEVEVVNLTDRLIEATPKLATVDQDVKARIRRTQSVARYLIRQRNFEPAARLIDHIVPILNRNAANALHLHYKVLSGDRDGALSTLDQSAAEASDKLRFRLQWNSGVRGGEIVKNIARSSNIDEARRARFIQQTSDLVNAVPQPVFPKAMAFMASLGCLNTLAIAAPVLVELKRLGYAVQHLSEGVLENARVNDRTTFAVANSIAGSIPRGNSDGTVQLEWRIDWPNKIVESHGINFYQGLYERLATHFRCFHVDVSEPEVGRWLNRYLVAMDTVLRACLRIERELVREGVPVILLVSNSHVAPYSVFRDFVTGRDNPKLRLTLVSVAYENYYTNIGSKFSGSMALVDRSLHRNCRAPFLPIAERFERWYANNEHSTEIEAKVNALLQTNRNQGTAPAAGSRLEILAKARARGVKVICCFGKLLCDMGVPYEGGNGHRDLVDWLRHTIEIVRDQNIILVIKPHPHELRPEIALDLTEQLYDVLPKELPDNVMVLGHKEFNVHEIVSQIDLAVLWSGTSGLEIAALGIPVMMCSFFGRFDYPLDLLYPESREQYADFIRAGEFPMPTPEMRRKAMGLLHYMGTEDVALPNRFSRRGSTNDSVGVPVWNDGEWKRYLAEGDKAVSLAAHRAVEGFELTISS